MENEIIMGDAYELIKKISEKWAKVARDRLEGVTKKEADSGFVQLKLAI